MNLPANLPDLYRAAGLTVVEIEGWDTRGRPGAFTPTGVLNHHTGASALGWSLAKERAYAVWMFVTGRSDLPAPLVQQALGRSGTVYIGAAGRANHAGTAKASGSVGAGDGNTLSAGIEWMLSGTEPIPEEMMEAGVTMNAVLTEKVFNTSVNTVSCHYNTSVTGKWDIGDPNGVLYNGKKVLDIVKFRAAVAARRADLYTNPPAGSPVPQIEVALCNVPIKVGANAWERCFRLAAKSPIVGLNESLVKKQRDLYQRLADEKKMGVSGLRKCGNPIFWARAEYAKISGQVHLIHEAGTGVLARKYPGYNAERTINEVVLRRRADGREVAVLNAHFVPSGSKVNPVWRDQMRRKSKKMLRALAQKHRKAGRVVVVIGDMNLVLPFSLGKGIAWLKGRGVDKIGANRKGSASEFKAPTDHKHGVRATLVV